MIGFASYQNPSKRMIKDQRRYKDEWYKIHEDQESWRHDNGRVAQAFWRTEGRWVGGNSVSDWRELKPTSPEGKASKTHAVYSAEVPKASGLEDMCTFEGWSARWHLKMEDRLKDQ